MTGKYVLNLLPEDAGHKGSALEHLIAASGAQSAIYVGDDVNDEDAFRLERCDLLSIRIGAADDSAADFYLDRQEDMRILLDEINSRLRQARSQAHVHLERADNM
jgi:trehalose 6-phosphate phosphatase